jgi:hypothetical protein
MADKGYVIFYAFLCPTAICYKNDPNFTEVGSKPGLKTRCENGPIGIK